MIRYESFFLPCQSSGCKATTGERKTPNNHLYTTDDGSNKYLSFVSIVAGGPAVAADVVEGAGPTGVGV